MSLSGLTPALNSSFEAQEIISVYLLFFLNTIIDND